MMGMESVDGDSRSTMGREAGIIPRFGFSLFERLSRGQDVGVEVSYFEIYNEKIRDLLSEEVGPASRTALRVREHPQQGPYVEGLATHSVATFESLQVTYYNFFAESYRNVLFKLEHFNCTVI